MTNGHGLEDDRAMSVRCATLAALLGFFAGGSAPGSAQQSSVPPASQVASAPDAAVDAASSLIGRALFLRCFCAENNLSFDAAGKPLGSVKPVDWTVGAVNVQKVERRGAGAVVLEGVRATIRYSAEAHEFQRKPQNDEKMRLQIADVGDLRQFERTLDAVFSMGIDLRFQHAMPAYWQHYFDPKLTWGQDALSDVAVYLPGPQGLLAGAPQPKPNAAGAIPPAAVTPAVVTRRSNASYTMFAQKERVRGIAQLRLVVDAEGRPQRIAIAQPLGYGLDERAVEAVAKMRFSPAIRDGQPVASSVLVSQEFEAAPGPR